MLPKKLPQTAIPKEQQITHPTKLRNCYPEREEPGQSGKELTRQTAEENITEEGTNLNRNSKKCGINPLKNTSLISKAR